MEQQSSTSKVTVEYFDPHDVYKLLAPGLVPRLPLHNLHWQSHAGPLRSIDTLHVELIQGGDDGSAAAATPQAPAGAREDGFQTQNVGGRTGSTDTVDTQTLPFRAAGSQRRHQIPGLRRTPYLKVLFVRCDDNDSYKNSVRAEVREWVKAHTPPSTSSKKASNQEKHDAFEWVLVHVVIPNTVAATQPRSTSSKSDTSIADKSSSRWRTGSTPLMEKLRSDFNSSSKGSVDRVTQIRIGINDVPYDLLPRVIPAVPSGYSETEQDAENAWNELMAKLKSQILSSFDMRVTQYEEDIKEKDAQRALPGWNFCTFFILKEGLARGFENVGLVEDALVGYDELSVGLDSVLQEQAETGAPESHGGAMLSYTEELKSVAEKALEGVVGDEEAVDLQSKGASEDQADDILISSTKKAYRDMILANKVSVFDFRCYLFSRQITLLLRLGNASSSREELLAKLKEQQESVLHGVAPLAPPPPKQQAQSENLSMLAEICRRSLQFIPLISQVMRQDIVAAMLDSGVAEGVLTDTVDNMAASFAFSVAQQILAQTATKALPIPPSTLAPADGIEPKSSIPEPKTMMHPARSSSLHIRPSSRPPPSPGVFPGPGRRASVAEGDAQNAQNAQFLKSGLEELAAKRAELYMMSRSILDALGKKRGWTNGWDEAPMVGDQGLVEMEEIDLDDATPPSTVPAQLSLAGVDSHLLQTAMDNVDDFYRLYEILTDKALRHYTVANHDHAVQGCMADLAVLKVHLKEYRPAAAFFYLTTPFFGESGWSLLELSMLVMYTQCLDELQTNDDYVKVALKLLTKACAAELERLEQKSTLLLKGQRKDFPDMSPVKGVVEKLFSSPLPTEVKVPLENFFAYIEVVGAPEYHDKRDSCSVSISVWSLLPDEIVLDGITLKATCIDGGPCKELSLEKQEEIVVTPGRNILKADCTSVVSGQYRIDQLGLSSGKIFLHYERDAHAVSDIFKRPEFALFQRTGALDVRLTATKNISLDKNNSLDLELSTGWSSLKSCELRVKPATGGLRLLTNEVSFVGSGEFAKPSEGGVFYFNAIDADTSVTIRFPYSVEHDVGDVSAKLEVSYVTESGESYYLAKSLAIPVALALGVNVQDVFKHNALFSRFNVSTASSSPLRLFKSELLSSDLFESEFGVPPSSAVIIFPKQAASLLYKVKRKADAKAAKRAGKTMYLKLYYSQLQTEIEELVGQRVAEALEQTPLKWYSRLTLARVSGELKKSLHVQDLERAALLGQVSTSFLTSVPWEQHFHGIGTVHGSTDDVGVKLSEFLRDWQKAHPRIAIPESVDEPSSILIPVEIPSLSVVHTADIRLQTPVASLIDDGKGATPTVCTNQMLPATLHLKWTRVWDTESSRPDDQEFSYEVTAAADTWLLGGRRKGHFVIPGSAALESSTPETEAEIPLILIPQREGWLPYPSVEVKEVQAEGAEPAQACEVDWKNLGETVRVVGERKGVTVSLDASGVAGGPLVLDSEGWGRGDGRIVA